VQVVSGKWWLAVPAYVGQVFRGAIGIAIACLTIRSGALNLFREEYSYMVYVTLITSVVVSALNCSRLHTAYLQLDGCMEHDSSVLLPAQPEVGIQNVRCPLCRMVFRIDRPSQNLECLAADYPVDHRDRTRYNVRIPLFLCYFAPTPILAEHAPFSS
jgi:hypothetical protein